MRELALGILLEVSAGEEYSHIALRNVLDKYQYLEKQERAFLTRLVEGTLERRMELDEDAKAELDRRQAVLLEHVKEQPEITVTWFCPDEKKSGGAYVVTTGRLKKVDETAGTLKLADGMTISLDEIVDLQCELFQGLI